MKWAIFAPSSGKPVQTVNVNGKDFNLYISYEQLKQRIAAMAQQINTDYAGKSPVFLAVLNGSFLFAADLLKEITLPCRISFVKLASYSGTSSSGQVKTLLGLQEELKGQDVLVLEDIVDTGLTLDVLLKELSRQEPASLKIASLLHKPAALKVPLQISYSGFEVDNDFLLGYGLDFDGYGRNLRHIYKLKN